MKRMNFEATKQKKSTSKNSEPECNKREHFQRDGTLACGGIEDEWKGRRERKRRDFFLARKQERDGTLLDLLDLLCKSRANDGSQEQDNLCHEKKAERNPKKNFFY